MKLGPDYDYERIHTGCEKDTLVRIFVESYGSMCSRLLLWAADTKLGQCVSVIVANIRSSI